MLLASFPYKRIRGSRYGGHFAIPAISYLLQLIAQPFVNIYRRLFFSRLLRSAKVKYAPVFKGGEKVRRFTETAVVKTERSSLLRCEVEAMRLVYARTTIPLPRVHDYWERGSKAFLVMDFVEGDNLKRVWHQLTLDQQRNVLQKLGGYVAELRSIVQPTRMSGSRAWVGSARGGPVWDVVLSDEDKPFGPFESQRAFNDWRVTIYDKFGQIHPPTTSHIAAIREAMPDDHPIVFTHGDIHRGNVVVNVLGDGPEDVKIVSLLDWGQSGWRPQYWEGFKAAWLGHDKGKLWKPFATQELALGYEDCVEREFKLLLVAGGIPP
ncbi:kinase-like protein [Schizopora paradoxa]|uniref:Kinase-like protein n=1 Tax=Schizopora paradoxa TaxID=27342 RepID=A0A0H2SAM1_9AGAM|nr:kinase-like protein [Schizopora paradoxa]